MKVPRVSLRWWQLFPQPWELERSTAQGTGLETGSHFRCGCLRSWNTSPREQWNRFLRRSLRTETGGSSQGWVLFKFSRNWQETLSPSQPCSLRILHPSPVKDEPNPGPEGPQEVIWAASRQRHKTSNFRSHSGWEAVIPGVFHHLIRLRQSKAYPYVQTSLVSDGKQDGSLISTLISSQLRLSCLLRLF